MTGVRIKSTVDGTTRDLKVTGCFIAIGHKPNTDLFAGQLEMKGGYIVTQHGPRGQRHRHQRPRRVRRGRRAGPRLPPGGHQRRHRLHGRARRRQVPGEPRLLKPARPGPAPAGRRRRPLPPRDARRRAGAPLEPRLAPARPAAARARAAPGGRARGARGARAPGRRRATTSRSRRTTPTCGRGCRARCSGSCAACTGWCRTSSTCTASPATRRRCETVALPRRVRPPGPALPAHHPRQGPGLAQPRAGAQGPHPQAPRAASPRCSPSPSRRRPTAAAAP